MLNADGVKILHFLPGRVRLKVSAIRKCSAEAEILGSALRSIPGVRSVEISTATGSVLIHYEASTLASEEARRRLRDVLVEHLPMLDADQVLRWLGAAGPQG